MVRRLIFETCSNCGKKITDDELAILVDEHNDLIFCSEKCIHENFEEEIEALEDQYIAARTPDDIKFPEFRKYEHFLKILLNEPDEVWEVDTSEDEPPMCFLIGEFLHEKDRVFYVAAVYYDFNKPVFVYMHFPTRDEKLIEKYRRDNLVFDATENDDLDILDDVITEENIAFQLYEEMLLHRSSTDIDTEDFSQFNDLKLSTVEKPSEVWRLVDDEGVTFLIYMASYQKDNENVTYIVVAIEDELTQATFPIFGFPTVDLKLVDRFRKGEMFVLKSSGSEF
ncbi:MAG: hypothetical protein SGI74_10115 [Oligoflexia bacterium]|nr:hypothetical protein [Oligoflexia bacterium]